MLYEVSNLPLLQNETFHDSISAISAPVGDVALNYDESGVVHNTAFEANRVKYGAHYDNRQSHSRIFLTHESSVISLVNRYLSNRTIIEIGCGKGDFLSRLRASGRDVHGFDPTFEGNSPFVRKENWIFDSEFTETDFVMRHVLEHIPRPFEFLQKLTKQVGKQTPGKHTAPARINLEVPSLD